MSLSDEVCVPLESACLDLFARLVSWPTTKTIKIIHLTKMFGFLEL